MHPVLKKYQGPALIAYNNAVFTENDFESLSRLGNSLKIQDGLTTGKFGRGFNSVSSAFRESDLAADCSGLQLDRCTFNCVR